jgi:hypothetical protein
MTIDEINTIRLALDTPEHNRHYVKHVTDAKMILNKEQEAINYSQCCKSDSELLPNMILEQAIAKAKPNLDKITDVDKHLEDIR